MNTKTQHAEKAAKDEWTYIDVMTTAIAYLDESRLFADTDLWNEAWLAIAENSETRELLHDLHFAKRGGPQPSSDQVESLIRTLSRSTIISLGNPRFLYFTVDKSAKTGILNRNRALIDQQKAKFEVMKSILREKLAVPNEE